MRGCAVVVLAVISPTYAWRMARGPMVGCHPSFHLRRASTAVALSPAEATPALLAAATVPNAIPSAFAAYGHYLAVILSAASLTAERLTIKPYMSMAEERVMAIADAVYGAAGLLLVGTGYLRVTQYGKGWEFYQHEPIFWLKLTLLSVAGASSFFPTIIIIQRSVAQRQQGDQPIEPMSERLAARMTSIINAELLAILSIPLTATLMSRGVGYMEGLPWQAGAAFPALALFGLGFKYVKEALYWQESPDGQ